MSESSYSVVVFSNRPEYAPRGGVVYVETNLTLTQAEAMRDTVNKSTTHADQWASIREGDPFA